MPVAYLIVEMHITDMERYKRYLEAAPATVKAAGGEYVIRGGRQESLEGGWVPQRVVVLKFTSLAAARAYYDSETYTQARKVREGAGSIRMVAVEGVD